MNEIDYYAALGISEQKQEVADPAPEPDKASGNIQEVAEPEDKQPDSGNAAGDYANDDGDSENDRETARETADDEDGAENDETDSVGGEEKMSKEQRAIAAAARRKAELGQEAAIAAAVEKAKAEEQARQRRELDSFFAQAGLHNPFDGNKPITSMEEFQSYRKAFDAQQLEKDLKSGKLTPETIERAVLQTPIVQKAAQVIQDAEKQAEEAKRVQAEAKVNEELAAITKLDPSITKLEDLLRMENAGEFREYVNKGYTLSDAFRLVNFDKLQAQRAQAAKQQAHNLANSKEHLTKTTGRGKGAAPVPKEIADGYRVFDPDITDAEIQAHYNNYKKATGQR